MAEKKVLLIKETSITRKDIEKILQNRFSTSYTVLDQPRALQEIIGIGYDLVLIEEEREGGAGLQILKKIKKNWPHTQVIFVPEYGDEDSYLEAMNLGAYEYLNPMVEWDRLPAIINKALS